MPEKYQNKYRIASARLKNWDYGANGAYFITICTANREHFFGEIPVETPKLGVSTVIQLSTIGQLAKQNWLEIPNHFSFIKLGNFVVMPNHVHGILIIHKMNNETITGTSVETPKLGVSTTAAATKKWKPHTIGAIINQYKRICTINARKINADFSWQPRFHDHIIRNHAEYKRIQNYIANNPLNWRDDKFSK